MKKNKAHEELQVEVEELKGKLAEAEETLRAIRHGEVDALVVSTSQGDQVFTLKGAERPYRILMEKMKEGAVTLAEDDSIFYCNQGFADMLKTPLEKMIGTGISRFVSPSDKQVFEELLRQGRESSSKGEVIFQAGDGTAVPTQLSVNTMLLDELSTVYLIATDITERKQAEEALQNAHDELEIKVKERTAELEEANEELNVEITERKRAEQLEKEAKMYAESIVETVREPLVVLDADLSVKTVNQAFYNTFKVSPEETVGKFIYDLGNRQWDIPKLRELLEEIISENTQVRDFEVDHEFQTIGQKTMLLNARRIYRESIGTQMILLAIEDITERKQAEEALKESEQRWVTTLASIGDAVIATDVEGRITFMNAVAEALTGWGLNEASTKPTTEVFKIINEQTRQTVEDPVARVLSQGMIVGLANHTILVRKDGSEVPIDDSGAPIRDGDGMTMGVVLVFRDITERKRSEEALRESEERYRRLFETMQENFSLAEVITDEQGRPVDYRFLEVNPALERYSGKSREQLMGRKHSDFMAAGGGAAEQKWFDIISKVGLTGKEESGEHYAVSTGRWAQFHAFSPQHGQCAVISMDITERKRAEEALQKAHDELETRVRERTAELEEANVELEAEIKERERAEQATREAHKYAENIVETLRESLIVLDAEMRVMIANQTFYETFKDAPEETLGKLIYELGNRQWDIPRLRELLDEIIHKNTQFYDFEVDHEFPNIGRKTMLLNARLLYQETPGTQLILLAIEDITEKKMLESQLLRSQRMESIGTLAGGIAHDLNNLLTPMMMSLNMLKQQYKDEQSQKLLTILENNSQRGANLIKQVMSFARGIEGERKPLQVAHIITEIEKVAKETFPRNIEIRTDLPKDLFTLSGDATQLHQVIMNMCVNARDAMPYGGILSISAENFFVDENYERIHAEAKAGSYVVISVLDTGTGIPPKILDRVFEPFFTTKEFGKGTGLGLSTALAIVKSHCGFINVYSESGKGTMFKVYLPAAITEVQTEVQKEGEEQLKLFIGHGELILVAEDEGSIREITISTLETYGYKVLATNNGADAVAEYAQNKDKIKVVLMDMMMPVMDGEASIRAIRKINPEVKVIVVSGLAEKDKLTKIESTHAQALLSKPYTAEILLKTISEVISAK